MATPIKIRLVRSASTWPVIVRLPFTLPTAVYNVSVEASWLAGGIWIRGKTTKRFAVDCDNHGSGGTLTIIVTRGE